MKRNLLFAFMALFIFSCAKDDFPNADYSGDDISVENRSAKVDVCHNGHVINVNVNALPAHRAHGDAVDMDGDGYFDKDNVCGPIDCDDTDASLTDDCCSDDCGFCPYLDLFDFDEDCDRSGPFGDHYCHSLTTYTGTYNDCQQYGYFSRTRLWDRDWDRHRRRYNCDTNDENDKGRILANYWDYTFQCNSRIGGTIDFFLYDYDTRTFTVPRTRITGETQEMHDLAKACAAVLNELAAEQNLVNECSDRTVSKQQDDQNPNSAYDLSENPEKFIEMLEAELDGDLPEELEDIFNPEK